PLAHPRGAPFGRRGRLALRGALPRARDPLEPDRGIRADRAPQGGAGSRSLEGRHLGDLGHVHPLEPRRPARPPPAPLQRAGNAPLAPRPGGRGARPQLRDQAGRLGLDLRLGLLSGSSPPQGRRLRPVGPGLPRGLFPPADLGVSPIGGRMRHWLYLVLSGLFEVGWIVSLKMSNGFSRGLPVAGYAVFGGAAAYFLSLSLKSIPMGIAYSAWMAVSVVGTLLVDVTWFKQPYSLARVVCALFIVLGTCGLKAAR